MYERSRAPLYMRSWNMLVVLHAQNCTSCSIAPQTPLSEPVSSRGQAKLPACRRRVHSHIPEPVGTAVGKHVGVVGLYAQRRAAHHQGQ